MIATQSVVPQRGRSTSFVSDSSENDEEAFFFSCALRKRNAIPHSRTHALSDDDDDDDDDDDCDGCDGCDG